jgi:hypothetical protein
MRFALAMCLLAALPAQSQTLADRLAEVERIAVVCGAWKPGTGLTREVHGNTVVLRGWIHSTMPGWHDLHGNVTVFGQRARGFRQLAGIDPIKTQGYHQIMVMNGSLEWTKPDGTREPVPSIYLYPA